MRSLIAVSAVILIVVSSSFGEQQSQGTSSELTNFMRYLQRTSTFTELTGESKVQVQADTAIVEISVITQESSLETCLKRNEETREDITTKLIKAGIPESKINGEKFASIFKNEKTSQYEGRNLIKVTITSETDFQETAKIIDGQAGVECSAISFKYSKEDEIKSQAANKALADMMKKEEEYENKLGLKLYLRSFSEQTILPQSGQNYNYEKKANSARTGEVQTKFSQASDEPTPTTSEKNAFSFGELVFAVRITGEFEIR